MDYEITLKENVKKNLSYIMKSKGLTQKSLAALLEISPANLNKVINQNQLPGVYPFIYNIRKHFNYSTDAFLFQDLEEIDNNRLVSVDTLSKKTISKYVAIYQVYYFNTDPYKGRVFSNGKALRCGIVALAKNETAELYAIALFNLSKEKADELYVKLKDCRSFELVKEQMQRSDKEGKDCLYTGSMKFTSKHIFLDLSLNDSDHMLGIFHNINGDDYNSYLGGLGAVVSLSRSRNSSSPCISYLAISKESLLSSGEEIASHLIMRFPKFTLEDDIDELLSMIRDFYNSDEYSYFNSDHKDLMIRYNLSNTINDLIEKNILRNITVSGRDDEDFYYYLKRASKKKGESDS